MVTFSKRVLGLTLLCCALAPAGAATLTDISFKSNGLSFINDTIAEGATSPLAFTAATGLTAPFLNAPDSSVSLGYGNYYAIAFLGFGQHLGTGLVSFRVDGGALVSQSVTFPSPASASGVFANFTLLGGDTVTIAATGLSGDRIRIVADGAGLVGDGTPDAFYAFNYASAVPEPGTSVILAGGLALLGLMLKRSKR
jgi:hypothetical protein